MSASESFAQRFRTIPLYRAFRHRDFRWLWTGAFLSFVGSWVQNVAQGWLVYELTGNEAMLALVTFCGMAPVSLVGPLAGALADTLNRRAVLIITQAVYGAAAIFMAASVYYGFVSYGQILIVSLITGLTSTVEIPCRQSLVSSIVPQEDLAAAVPINAMTFNLARVFGPALGGWLLAKYGAQTCYLVNGISYFSLIIAVLGMRIDMRATARERQPIGDLVLEGMRYTLRDVRLRTLFLLECAASGFGLFYLSLMPAIVDKMLGLGKAGLGNAMSSVGIGAMVGLVLVITLSDKPIKPLLVRCAVTSLGLSLTLMSFARSPWVAFPLFGLAGMSAMIQFNTTNTLFQLLSPEHLRGRVLAMHVWALAGFSPLGVLFFGWLARNVSIPAAQFTGGSLLLGAAALGWRYRRNLAGVT